MTNGILKNRPGQKYEITVYDNKTIEENGSLDQSHFELEETCRKFAEDFSNKYKGRLNLKIITR